MKTLFNLNILFYAPEFFDLHSQIIESLTKLGANVTYCRDKPSVLNPRYTQSSLIKVKKIVYYLFNPDKHYTKYLLNRLPQQTFDILFCIDGFSLTPEFILEMKRRNPDIKCVLYLWDSMKYFNFNYTARFFDYVSTFDKLDAKKFKFTYKPLFWMANEKNTLCCLPEYDISFIGSLHSTRYACLKLLKNYFKEKNVRTYFKLVVNNKKGIFRHIKYVYHKIWNSNTSYVTQYNYLRGKIDDNLLSNVPVPRIEFENIMNKSNCILDLEIPGQAGQTNRLIAALANNKKVLTTNPAIADSGLFDSCQIMILDWNNMDVVCAFVQEKLPPGYVNKYVSSLRIDKWLISLLALK